MSNLTRFDKITIESLADYTIKAILSNDKSAFSNSPFNIISNINKYIIIRFPSSVEYQSDSENLSGFSFEISEFKCIYINSNDLLARQYFSCWHEYYHTIHRKSENSSIENNDIEEQKANYFASCMMMPQNNIKKYLVNINKSYSELNFNDLIFMQHYFKVSLSALVMRISEIYSINKYDHLMKYRLIKYNDELLEKTRHIKDIMDNSDSIDLLLLKPTNDFILPKKFLESVIRNTENDKISLDKSNDILSLIEDKEVRFLW